MTSNTVLLLLLVIKWPHQLLRLLQDNWLHAAHNYRYCHRCVKLIMNLGVESETSMSAAKCFSRLIYNSYSIGFIVGGSVLGKLLWDSTVKAGARWLGICCGSIRSGPCDYTRSRSFGDRWGWLARKGIERMTVVFLLAFFKNVYVCLDGQLNFWLKVCRQWRLWRSLC